MGSQSGQTAPGAFQTALVISGLLIIGQHQPQAQLPRIADTIRLVQSISIANLPELWPANSDQNSQSGQDSSQHNPARSIYAHPQANEIGQDRNPTELEDRVTTRVGDDAEGDDDD